MVIDLKDSLINLICSFELGPMCAQTWFPYFGFGFIFHFRENAGGFMLSDPKYDSINSQCSVLLSTIF